MRRIKVSAAELSKKWGLSEPDPPPASISLCPQAWRYRCEIAVIDDVRDAMVGAAVRRAVNVAVHTHVRPAQLSIEARMLRMQADAPVMQASADAA